MLFPSPTARSSPAEHPSDAAAAGGDAGTMIRLVYTSEASKAPTPTAVAELLRTCRRRNEAAGLTGLLIHHQMHYLQCLEGPPGDVLATFARIQADARHHAVSVRSREPIRERAFGSWFMAYAVIGPKTWTMLDNVDWRDTEAYTYSDDDHPGELPRGFALLERVWDMYRNTLQADRGPPD